MAATTVGAARASTMTAAYTARAPVRVHASSTGAMGRAAKLGRQFPREGKPAKRSPAGALRTRGVVVAAAAATNTCSRDLLVVGPGVLGSLVCQKWLKVSAAFFRGG